MISQRLSRRSAPSIARQINRAPSPVVAYAAPWLTIMLASMMGGWVMVAQAPIMPPLGFMAMLAWRQLRPGLLPVWAGLPLGLVDDLFSGQVFGSAILVWSITLIVLDVIEARFPWRGFVTDWLVASCFILAYLAAGLAIANHTGGATPLVMMVPQMVLSVLCYPVAGRVVGMIDRWRLTRFRVIG